MYSLTNNEVEEYSGRKDSERIGAPSVAELASRDKARSADWQTDRDMTDEERGTGGRLNKEQVQNQGDWNDPARKGRFDSEPEMPVRAHVANLIKESGYDPSKESNG